MTSKQITFSDIQTSDLIYYDKDDHDPKLADQLTWFCQKRDITCLPSLTNPYKFYQHTAKGFSEKDVVSPRRVMGNQNIFAPWALGRFEKYKLMFVYTEEELTGVVHFCDYNRPAVNVYLFELLFSYERLLRRMLELEGLNDATMLAYLSKTQKKAEGDGQEKIPVFERFNLSDLIGLATHCTSMSLNSEVNKLRNMVMHAHELVHLAVDSQDDYIYNYESFKRFFNRVGYLFSDYRKVRSRVALLEQTKDMPKTSHSQESERKTDL